MALQEKKKATDPGQKNWVNDAATSESIVPPPITGASEVPNKDTYFTTIQQTAYIDITITATYCEKHANCASSFFKLVYISDNPYTDNMTRCSSQRL